MAEIEEIFCDGSIITSICFVCQNKIERTDTSYFKIKDSNLTLYCHKTCYENYLKETNLKKEIEELQKQNKILRSNIKIDIEPLTNHASSYRNSPQEFLNNCISYYINNHKVPIVFNKESEFQEYIVSNLSQIELGLTLKAQYYSTTNGEIDILCSRGQFDNFIIEVKLVANHTALSQLLLYMQELEQMYHLPCTPKGIIIGTTISKQLISATKFFNRNAEEIRLFEFDYSTRRFINKLKL